MFKPTSFSDNDNMRTSSAFDVLAQHNKSLFQIYK